MTMTITPIQTDKIKNQPQRRNKITEIDDMVGRCLQCGHRLTLCGVPITLSVECSNCKKINNFVHSRQPVSVVDRMPTDGCG